MKNVKPIELDEPKVKIAIVDRQGIKIVYVPVSELSPKDKLLLK